MLPTVLIFLIFSPHLIIPAKTHLQSGEEGFISATISEKGLDFFKGLLVNKAVSSLTPLELPQIEQIVKIPIVGHVRILLSDIALYEVDISSSYVSPGKSGIAVVASGATANLSMNWSYSYHTWLVPVPITDGGQASVQVEGMEVGFTLSLKNQEGTIRLSLLECGCHVDDIFIKLDGGASWLYQVMVNAFENKIKSSIEEAISKKIAEVIFQVDSEMQNLPKKIQIHSLATLNVTVVNDIVLSDTFIGFEINGLFTAADKMSPFKYDPKKSQPFVSCGKPAKMIGLLLHQNVINSALVTFFSENIMTWTVDKVTDQSLLNTAGWKDVVPELYKQYPNDDMILNISASSPPNAKILDHNIDATAYLDITIKVLNSSEMIPVACIALVLDASGFAKISRNNLSGAIRLDDFTMNLKWSKIGDLQMNLIQPVISSLLKTIVLPYVNLRLSKGFPLPTINGFTLENTELSTDSVLTICSDVAFAGQYDIGRLQLFHGEPFFSS